MTALALFTLAAVILWQARRKMPRSPLDQYRARQAALGRAAARARRLNAMEPEQENR